jgi:FAD synthetase
MTLLLTITIGLVMLIVLLACYARRYSPPKPTAGANLQNGATKLPPFPETLHSVYIVSADPFAEVDDFVEKSSEMYHLDVARFTLPMKLKHFDPTDAGWPDFMRIHPVIDWHYSECCCSDNSLVLFMRRIELLTVFC